MYEYNIDLPGLYAASQQLKMRKAAEERAQTESAQAQQYRTQQMQAEQAAAEQRRAEFAQRQQEFRADAAAKAQAEQAKRVANVQRFAAQTLTANPAALDKLVPMLEQHGAVPNAGSLDAQTALLRDPAAFAQALNAASAQYLGAPEMPKQDGLNPYQAAQLAEQSRHNRATEAQSRAALGQDAWAVIADPTTGAMVRYNRKTGQTEHVGAPGVGADGKTPARPGVKLTDAQAKSFSAVKRAREARDVMNRAGIPTGIAGRKDAWATGASGGVMGAVTPQEAASKEGQEYFTSARNLVGAFLRKESGAAISNSEWEYGYNTYIPMPWDDPQTVTNKQKMLDVMMDSLIEESGPSGAAALRRDDAPRSQPNGDGTPDIWNTPPTEDEMAGGQ